MHGLIGLIVFILDIIAIVDVVKSTADGTKKAIWIVLIICLPFIGMLLWFLLGRKDA